MRGLIVLSLAGLAAVTLMLCAGCSKPGETPAKPDNATAAPQKGVFERAGEKTGEALKKGAQETGEALEKGAKATGKALDKARHATGVAVKKTGEWILDNDTTDAKKP